MGWDLGPGGRPGKEEKGLPAAGSGSLAAGAAARSPAPPILRADDQKHDLRAEALGSFSVEISLTDCHMFLRKKEVNFIEKKLF